MHNPYASQANRFTRLSKALSAVLLLLCAATYFAPSSRLYLTLVPGRTLPCIWNVFTAGFVTSHPLKALAEVGALLLLARSIEPVYGSTELSKLIVLVNLAAGCTTFVGVYLIYIAAPSRSETLLYAQFSGFHGVVGALLVALKQIMPEQDLVLGGGAFKLRVRLLALTYLVGAAALSAGLRAWSALPFLVLGMAASWVYLRFYQSHPDTQTMGDPSDDFALVSFLPVTSAKEGSVRTGSGIPANVLPTSVAVPDHPDASRRRERGAKALEERLNQAGKRSGVAPDLEGVEGGKPPVP